MKKIATIVLFVIAGFLNQSWAYYYTGPTGEEIAQDAYAVTSLFCDADIEDNTQVITVKKAKSDGIFIYGFYVYLPEGGYVPLEETNSISAGIKSDKEVKLLSIDCSSYEQLISDSEPSTGEFLLWDKSAETPATAEDIPSSPPSYMCTINDNMSGNEKLLVLLLYKEANGVSCIADLISGKNITLAETKTDTDSDAVFDESDNAPDISNPEQEDTDNDGIGDVSDPDSNAAGDDCSLNPAATNSVGMILDLLFLGIPALLIGIRRK